MANLSPFRIILVGFLLVLFGFLVPFLTTLQLIEASFFWLFLSFATSVAGLMLGLIGAAWYTRIHRK